MKFFIPAIICTAHVWVCTASLDPAIAFRAVLSSLNPGQVVPEPSQEAPASGFTRAVCSDWLAKSGMDPGSKEAKALAYIGELDRLNCVSTRFTSAINCNVLDFIKKASGGSVAPSFRKSTILGVSSKASTTSDESRVTGLFVGVSSQNSSILKSLFDKFMTSSLGSQGSSMMKDTIVVDEGKQELTIATGTRVGDISVFTHLTKQSPTKLYVILYMGSRSLQDGVALLQKFRDDNAGNIQSALISTSQAEQAEAKATEEATEKLIRANSQVASFALDLLCRAGGN